MTSFYRGGRGNSRPDREQLRLDLVDHDDRTPPARTWRETEKSLEAQATEIICGILLRVEKDAREGALWRHKYNLEERARKARDAKLAAEKAEADRIARNEAAAAARIKSLLGCILINGCTAARGVIQSSDGDESWRDMI
jgi:hypothetical protein